MTNAQELYISDLFQMGSSDVLENSIFIGTNANMYVGNGMPHCNVVETDNTCANLLDGLDSYLEEVNDRLTISRMVNESVIKGMVRGIQQECAEEIAKKDTEISKLKEMHRLYPMKLDRYSYQASSEKFPSKEMRQDGRISDILASFEATSESYANLKIAATREMGKLKQKLEMINGSGPRRRSCASKGDIADDSDYNDWIDVQVSLKGLGRTLQEFYQNVEGFMFSKSSLYISQEERIIQDVMEGAVIKICVSGAQDECEKRVQSQHAALRDCIDIKGRHNMKKISELREDLDAISKLLSFSDNGFSVNDLKTTTLGLKDNGNHISSSVTVQESMGLEQLMRLSKDQLISYFKSQMVTMKRDFEQKIQEKTEQVFSLKRNCMKEAPLSTRIIKGYDCVGARIPEIIQSLHDILDATEKWVAVSQDMNGFNQATDRFSSLSSEIHQLRNLLAEKKREVLFLSSNVSDLTDKVSCHFMAESKLIKLVRNIKQEKQDVLTLASLNEDIFKIVVNEALSQLNSCKEDSGLKCDDLDAPCHNGNVEILAQGLREVVLNEALKDANEKHTQLMSEYEHETEYRLCLEHELVEKEHNLSLNASEKDVMKQEISMLLSRICEKDELIKEIRYALQEETVKLDETSAELMNSRIIKSQLEKIISKFGDVMQIKLVETMIENQLQEFEESQRRKTIDLLTEKVNSTTEERKILLSEIEKLTCTLNQYEGRENESRKLLNVVAGSINEFTKRVTDFECLTVENIKRNRLRLKRAACDLSTFGMKASLVRKVGTVYKERLDRKISDLHKAETEVDLLGDEVDALFSLLEKIYIALDHYYPVLVHYPGITETLKMVRRKLCGEGFKRLD